MDTDYHEVLSWELLSPLYHVRSILCAPTHITYNITFSSLGWHSSSQCSLSHCPPIYLLRVSVVLQQSSPHRREVLLLGVFSVWYPRLHTAILKLLSSRRTALTSSWGQQVSGVTDLVTAHLTAARPRDGLQVRGLPSRCRCLALICNVDGVIWVLEVGGRPTVIFVCHETSRTSRLSQPGCTHWAHLLLMARPPASPTSTLNTPTARPQTPARPPTPGRPSPHTQTLLSPFLEVCEGQC